MHDITSQFSNFYRPQTALIFYQHAQRQDDFYVESYQIDPKTNQPVNAHPLSVDEATALGKRLNSDHAKFGRFLTSDGILPENVLYVNPRDEGMAIWYTRPSRQTLHFSPSLNMPEGKASVPALLWKATRTRLTIFALSGNKRPTSRTPLFHAPLFNTSLDGSVCIGDVKMPNLDNASLKEFMQAWHNFYFNSRFSHLNGHLPANVDVKKLWRDLIETDAPFPNTVLLSTNRTLSTILPR